MVLFRFFLLVLLLFLLPVRAESFFYSLEKAQKKPSPIKCELRESRFCSSVDFSLDSTTTLNKRIAPFPGCRNAVNCDKSFSAKGFTLFNDFIPSSVAGRSISEDYLTNKKAKKAVDRHIRLFSTRARVSFSRWLSRSSMYESMIKDILAENDLPNDLFYLPLIESGFNTRAYSRAHASGPWQFMKATAKTFGLEVSFWVDERRDPVKSTLAASGYLKYLHRHFGSWDLSLAAYNAGEGKIKRALKRSGADDFWSITETRHIRNETKNFVPKFIAAREIGRSPQFYGFHKIDYKKPLDFDTVVVKPPADIAFIAEAAGATESAIRELNPEIIRWCLPPHENEYLLRLPPGTKDMFLTIYNGTPAKDRFALSSYRLRRGDTLYKIARKENIPLNVLYALNRISNPRKIKEGKVLYLPPKKKKRSKSRIADKNDISYKSKTPFKKQVVPIKKRVPATKSST